MESAVPGFVKVAIVEDLHERRGTLVTINGDDIALFKRNGTVYAMSNVCAHQHFSRLHEGDIRDETVTCPMHGWTYDMRTGKSLSGQGSVRCYSVKLVGHDVLLEVPSEG